MIYLKRRNHDTSSHYLTNNLMDKIWKYKEIEDQIVALSLFQRTVNGPITSSKSVKLKINHTVKASAMPDSNNASRAEGFKLPDTSFLSSVLILFKSDLYSRNLARSTALMFGCKLLASRSIFRIYKSIRTNISESHNKAERKETFKQKKAKRVPKLLLHQFQPLFLKSFASFALQIEQKRHKS